MGNGNLQKGYINGNKAIIIGNTNTFIASDDGGQTWKDINIPEDPSLKNITDNIDFNGLSQIENVGYASFGRFKWIDYDEGNDIYWSGGILYTDDNWETAKSIDVAKIGNADEYKNDSTLNPNHKSCNGVDTKAITYLGEENGEDVLLIWVQWYVFSGADKQQYSRIFKTIDGGKNWTIVSDNIGDNRIVQVIEAKNDTVYVGGNKVLLKSLNGGDTFENIYPNLDINEDDNMFIYSIWIANENEIFLTTTSDSIHTSTDGGNTFSTISNAKGSNDFYKFDSNSYMILGSNAEKSWFTNTAGEIWQECFPGSAIFKIGGIYNDNLYALGKGVFYTVNIDSLHLKTSARLITKTNDVKIEYHKDYIKLVSSDKIIDRCYVYSLSGQLVSIVEGNSNVCQLNNNEFKSGLYIISASVGGEKFSDKIVFK